MNDKINLARFTIAQQNSFDTALEEIRNGKKESEWMWFIFPQMKGLGKTNTSKHYAVNSLEEAEAYMRDAQLSRNLRTISQALLDLETNDIKTVLKSPDDLKLNSSMTLFAHATDDNQVFLDVIDKFYGGKQDELTLKLIEK